jgi:hypothetical protein
MIYTFILRLLGHYEHLTVTNYFRSVGPHDANGSGADMGTKPGLPLGPLLLARDVTIMA